jgi:hypothetical protein
MDDVKKVVSRSQKRDAQHLSAAPGKEFGGTGMMHAISIKEIIQIDFAGK